MVALQELSPGRADGKPLPTTGSVRQTVSLVNALRAAGGSRYRLVRTTPYVKPGVPEGSQGARILYDTSRYSLVSPCPETARDGSYSSSCTIVMPLRASDSATIRRRAAYAVLADRATGKRFFVVSAHLDARHSTNTTTEHSYEALRASQAKAVLARVTQLNTAHLPVVLAGDLNTWQNNKAGYGAHDALIASGYYDTAAALTQVNVRYTTMNAFARDHPRQRLRLGRPTGRHHGQGRDRRCPVRERDEGDGHQPAQRPQHGGGRHPPALTGAGAGPSRRG